MQNKKKVYIIIGVLVLLIVILMIIILSISNNKEPDINIIRSDAEQYISEVVQSSNPIQEAQSIQEKEIDGIYYKNIYFYKEEDVATFIAEAYSVARNIEKDEKYKLVFYDINHQKVGDIQIIVSPVTIGNSVVIRTQSSEVNYDLNEICDFEIE